MLNQKKEGHLPPVLPEEGALLFFKGVV